MPYITYIIYSVQNQAHIEWSISEIACQHQSTKHVRQETWCMEAMLHNALTTVVAAVSNVDIHLAPLI